MLTSSIIETRLNWNDFFNTWFLSNDLIRKLGIWHITRMSSSVEATVMYLWKRCTIIVSLTLLPDLDAMSRRTCVGCSWLVTVALRNTLYCIAHLASNTRNYVPGLSPLLGHLLWLKYGTCICIRTFAYQYFDLKWLTLKGRSRDVSTTPNTADFIR